jgi:KilA-N domain
VRSMSQISKFNFNGTPIRDEAEFLCLTDMWRAAGGDPSKRPSKYTSLEQAKEFVEFIAENLTIQNPGSLLRVTEGAGGSTWAHW